MLSKTKRAITNFHLMLALTREESLSVYPAMFGFTLLAIQVITTWLFGLDVLYIGLFGFILLFIGSLMANVLKTRRQ